MMLTYFAILLFEYLMSLVYVKKEILWDGFLDSLCIYFDALKLHKYISSVKGFKIHDSGPAGLKTDSKIFWGQRTEDHWNTQVPKIRIYWQKCALEIFTGFC